MSRAFWTTCLSAAVLMISALEARAATFVVTTTADDVDAAPGNGVCLATGGGCTLRAAIQESNALAGPDTITVPAGTYHLTVTGRDEEDAATGDLDIVGTFGDNLTINGAGATATVIDGDGADRVFHVCPSGFNCVANRVDINDLEITDGDPVTDGGGGVRNRAILTLTRVIVDGNSISVGCGAGIHNVDTGTLTVNDSTISQNIATSQGGGGLCNHFGAIAQLNGTTIKQNQALGVNTLGGGILNMQSVDLALTNCTVTGNVSAGDGGGIFNLGGFGSSRTMLNNVTITGNTAGVAFSTPAGGGGVGTAYSFAFVVPRNTIIAGNTDLSGRAPDCGGQIDTKGYNLIQDTTGCSFVTPDATDILGVSPTLGPLQNNGGPTETYELLSGSPAINAGNPGGCEIWRQGVLMGTLSADQRGVGRPQGAACDIGAFELVTCGDGTVGPGEECDDGNQANGDCCDATCQFESSGSGCSDGNGCTTADACDGAGLCVGGPPPNCDDSDPCTIDSCVAPSGCSNDLPTGCRSAGKSILLLKNNADDSKDGVTWKWIKGAATSFFELASPPTTTTYTLCVHAGGDTARVALPAGGKWIASGTKGFKFADATGVPSGAQKAQILTGGAGKAKAQVKGKGANLPDDLIGMLPLPVTVQLVNDANAICYESVFNNADVIKNDGVQFKAKH